MATSAMTSTFERMVAKYRQDHTHPVNQWMHVGVGWPMVGGALLLLPFRPWWSLVLFLIGYAVMWTGHFVFERNIPTILKHPTAPFYIGWAVIRVLCGTLALQAIRSRDR